MSAKKCFPELTDALVTVGSLLQGHLQPADDLPAACQPHTKGSCTKGVSVVTVHCELGIRKEDPKKAKLDKFNSEKY